MVYIEKFQKKLYRCAYPCSNVKNHYLYTFLLSVILQNQYIIEGLNDIAKISLLVLYN